MCANLEVGGGNLIFSLCVSQDVAPHNGCVIFPDLLHYLSREIVTEQVTAKRGSNK